MRSTVLKHVIRPAAGLMALSIASWAIGAMPDAPPMPSVKRSVAAISYGAGAVSKTDLKGTDVAPKASGKVKIDAKQGTIQASVSVRDLPDVTTFGPEFLTYVVWAVPTEGRPRNLGEIAVKKGKGSATVTTQVPAFGIVVTAEPYFSTVVPSEVVVLRNVFSEKVAKTAMPKDVSFDTFTRTTYAGTDVKAPDPKAKNDPPIEVYQARNAVRIANKFGADKYAADAQKKASDALWQAESYWSDKKQKKSAPAKAREAVQSAEAARNASVKNIGDARAAAQQAEAQAKAAEAQAKAAEAQAAASKAQAEAAEEARKRGEAETAAAHSDMKLQQAEMEKQQLRAKLLQQFNRILETRDSARGLIVNLGDVLFDTNKSELKPGAKEKLAKLSGLVLANAGLKLAVEGHTDAQGSEEHNQKLSESRAGSVREYLVAQGVTADSVSAHGYGKAQPVATNDTSEGRAKNRRVEIIVSGDAIGTTVAAEKGAVAPGT